MAVALPSPLCGEWPHCREYDVAVILLCSMPIQKLDDSTTHENWQFERLEKGCPFDRILFNCIPCVRMLLCC
jgi:hypothetical protein